MQGKKTLIFLQTTGYCVLPSPLGATGCPTTLINRATPQQTARRARPRSGILASGAISSVCWRAEQLLRCSHNSLGPSYICACFPKAGPHPLQPYRPPLGPVCLAVGRCLAILSKHMCQTLHQLACLRKWAQLPGAIVEPLITSSYSFHFQLFWCSNSFQSSQKPLVWQMSTS
jgi:hypothetical protein